MFTTALFYKDHKTKQNKKRNNPNISKIEEIKCAPQSKKQVVVSSDSL